MSQGRTCSIHNQFCPDGVCKYCEPLDPPVPAEYVPPHPDPQPVPIALPSIWAQQNQQRRGGQ